MIHFANFAEGADFGITKQLNKAKRSVYDNMTGYTQSRAGINNVLAQVNEPVVRSSLNKEMIRVGRQKIAKNTRNIKTKIAQSNPVSGGQPNYDYQPHRGELSLDKIYDRTDRIKTKNIKSVLSNAQNRRGYTTVKNTMGYVGGNAFLPDYKAKEVYDSTLKEVRANRAKQPQPRLKPALLAKSERLDFSPTTEQLQGVLNKNYPDYKDYVNHPKDLLITGSPNHTWLTNNGKYMEMPIGQQEMPLDASMWKGRKSGMRLPQYEVKGIGEQGSPVLGIKPANLYNLNANNPFKHFVENNLIQSNDSYKSQIASKRYVPKE